jgi:diguanylate cyclase (GGDEF)-like protein/putative nucleotidyltransferase with HDIG domain
MPKLSASRWTLVIAAVTVAAVAGEVRTRPSAPYLFTPLVAAAAALGFAYRVFLRDQAARQHHDRQAQRSAAVQLATIEAVALAIDARHRASQSPLRREQRHAAALAKALDMSGDDVECVRTAALLHDVGTLAVPDHILSKPGALTDDERRKMRTHVTVGTAIIQGVPFPYPVADLVRSHHERWDGTGYPAGLRGADIPLGARILAVVDCFAAITSERAFKPALPAGEAIDVLREEAGKGLDPAVVARYVELLPALRKGDEAEATTLLDDIGGAHREESGLYAIAETMGTSLGVADSMSVIAAKLKDLVPFTTCALFVYDPANGVSHCRFATGAGHEALPGLLVRDGLGLVGKAIASRESVTNGDPAADFEMTGPDLAGAPLKSALVCPLLIGDTTKGALALYHTAPDHFTDDHRRVVGRVSGQIAAVINNAIVFEETRAESVTDPLTGLPNIRILHAHAGRELARAARLKSSVTIMLLDLDNLKPINDTFGHQAGNRALCAVAAALRGAIRPYDICVRYGGDEFLILLSDFGADQAHAKQLELQKAVESSDFSAGDMLRVRLTISVGAAVFPADADSYEALLQVADSRMYEDKARRKSRTAGKVQRFAPETSGQPSVRRS